MERQGSAGNGWIGVEGMKCYLLPFLNKAKKMVFLLKIFKEGFLEERRRGMDVQKESMRVQLMAFVADLAHEMNIIF